MGTARDDTSHLSPLKRAYLALDVAQARIDELVRAKTEPIAVVGMGCRLPGGVNGPGSYWELLRDGVDAVCEMPSDRWNVDKFSFSDPGEDGETWTRFGGFLRERIDQFDPQFFGISPREAESMDPQQRLLLEVAWEALENGAQAGERLPASPTGVFVGITTHDYADLQERSDAPRNLGMHNITGSALNAAAGRLSYCLGYSGPCMAIDTACSSSLVAVHLACRSLVDGECSRALAGGVNLILSPVATVALSRANVLALDGRSRAFDKAARGMVRAEGCGVIVLKRLSQALKDNDSVLALIRGSAVNQDGPSGGLTVPNGPAQEALIRRALAVANLDPSDIDYVEAHGTGTPLGDPIELRALGNVFSERPHGQLIVGSVKTNIGHTEACAGIAGMIKVILSLRNQAIPPNLHFHEPTPHVPWDELPLTVPTRLRPWRTGGRLRRAGISAFGFSGVNAHVVLEEALPASPGPVAESRNGEDHQDRPLHLLALSGRSEGSLRQLGERFATHLGNHPELAARDVCYSANVGRVHLNHRLGIVAGSTAEASELLSAFLAGGQADGLAHGQVSAPPKVVFVFAGQAPRSASLGRDLYDNQPTFRRVLNDCSDVLGSDRQRPLLDELFAPPLTGSPPGGAEYSPPGLFALEYALAKLWLSWGVQPGLVMGHGVGEFVAAAVAGVFGFESGLALVAEWDRLLQTLPRDGAMFAVSGGEQAVEAAVRSFDREVSIAAINGPASTVISGRSEAVGLVVANLRSSGIKSQPLGINHALHSPLVDPILSDFARRARGVTYSAPQISLVSGLDGRLASTAITSAEHWKRLVRAPIRFADGVQTLRENGGNLFLELGPHQTLIGPVRCPSDGGESDWLPGLQTVRSGWRQMLDTLARLYVSGVHVDWPGFDRHYHRRRVELPTYPFERQRYWLDALSPQTAHPAAQGTGNRRGHPLLGDRLDLAGSDQIRFESRLSRESTTYLRDHRVFGEVVVPATAFLEIALAAGAEALGTIRLELRDVVIEQPLMLPESEWVTLQTVLTPRLSDPLENKRGVSPAGDEFSFEIFTHSSAAEVAPDTWIRHTVGTVSRLADSGESHPAVDMKAARVGAPTVTDELYDRCRQRGVEFGDSFRTLRSYWRHGLTVLGHASLPSALISDADAYVFHPALLDGGLHVLAAMELESTDTGDLHLPVAISRFRLLQPPGTEVWSHGRRQRVLAGEKPSNTGPPRPETLTVDLEMVTATGEAVATIAGLQLKSATRESMVRMSRAAFKNWLYRVEWRSTDLIKPQPEIASNIDSSSLAGQAWLVVSSSGHVDGRAEKLVRRLQARGASCTIVSYGDEFQRVSDGSLVLDPLRRDHFQRLVNDRATSAVPLRGVVLIGGAHDGDSGDAPPPRMEDLVLRDCASLLHLVQSILEAGLSGPPTVWTIGCGAQAVLEGENLPGITQAALWGLVKTILLEHPELDCRYADLDPHEGDAQLDMLCAELVAAGDEQHVAFRHGQRRVARIAAYRKLPTSPGAELAGFRADASYLITGGLRGLGLEVARWMADRGAGRLVLVGRTAPGAEARRRIDQIQQAGTAVNVLELDVSDARQVAGLRDRLASGPPLRGVVHCAMVLDDGILMKQTAERFRGVLAPKVAGAWNLHELTHDTPLDFFLLFSSSAALLGSPGQSSYCAANAFLDSLAEHRRSRGLPGMSINWGPWSGMGIVARSHQDGGTLDLVGRIRDRGIQLIPPRQGLQVLEQLLADNPGQVAVLPGNWSALPGLSSRGIPSLLRDLVRADAVATNNDVVARQLRALRGSNGKDRRAVLVAFLRDHVAAVLRARPDQIDASEGLNMLGLDSLMAVELRNRVDALLHIDVPMVKFMDGQSVLQLADEIDRRMPTAGHADGLTSERKHHARDLRPADVNKIDSLKAQKLLARLDDLSDDEVEALLTGNPDNAFAEGAD